MDIFEKYSANFNFERVEKDSLNTGSAFNSSNLLQPNVPVPFDNKVRSDFFSLIKSLGINPSEISFEVIEKQVRNSNGSFVFEKSLKFVASKNL